MGRSGNIFWVGLLVLDREFFAGKGTKKFLKKEKVIRKKVGPGSGKRQWKKEKSGKCHLPIVGMTGRNSRILNGFTEAPLPFLAGRFTFAKDFGVFGRKIKQIFGRKDKK